MNVFAIICLGLVILCIYALVAFEIGAYRQAAYNKRNPTSMEDRAKFQKFSFVHDGFKYQGDRSTTVISNIEKSSERVGTWTTYKTIKTSVMVDSLTNMPFYVILVEEAYQNSSAISIHQYRPIFNKADMIDAVGAIRSYKLEDLDLDQFVYLDDVCHDETAMMVSHGLTEMVTA